VKKLINSAIFFFISIAVIAQPSNRAKKDEKKEERRVKINALKKQAEEGTLVFRKQSIFGGQLRTNGYGAFYELGKMKTNRKTNIYRIDFTEIKDHKEEKSTAGGVIFGNPYVYGKENNFYQITLGFGQQYILGQKGNKNGVSVSAIYNGGLAVGLKRPYYVEARDAVTGTNRFISYKDPDKTLFLDNASIIGGGGLGRGWGEIKMAPGAFAKIALRFDYGRFNDAVSGLEIGISGDFYSSKIPVLLFQKERQFFYQAYIAVLFGKRK
jgi:hypothetical protein